MALLASTLSVATFAADPEPGDNSETKDEAPAEAETPPEPPPPPLYRSRSERDMKLLARQQNPDSVVWLKGLEGEFLGLFEAETTGEPVGALLMVNAEGQHGDWPVTSERIRLSLPEFGWNTLSIELPSPSRMPVPPREMRPDPAPQEPTEEPQEDAEDASAPENTDHEETTAAEETTENTAPETRTPSRRPPSWMVPDDAPEMRIPPEDLAVERLKSAVSYLQQKGQFNLVLAGEGIGATRAACFVGTLPAADPNTQTRIVRALVLINPRNDIVTAGRKITDCLRHSDMPVLDLYTGSSSRELKDARLRMTAAKRAGYSTYQQLRMPEMSNYRSLGENRLSRRVRGFLETHARGVKVDNAKIIN